MKEQMNLFGEIKQVEIKNRNTKKNLRTQLPLLDDKECIDCRYLTTNKLGARYCDLLSNGKSKVYVRLHDPACCMYARKGAIDNA